MALEFENSRTEASLGLENSEDTLTGVLGNGENHSTSVKTVPQDRDDINSPTSKLKRKRNSSPYSPSIAEGFGNSLAGEILTQFPELKEIFTICCKVGEGTFSNVYLARMQAYPEELWALKHIIPTSGPERIENELKCLQTIGGKDNVIGIETTYRRNDHIVFVLPYFPHEKFQDYLLDMSVCEIREYIKNLFIALKRVHEFEVIHRDIKPSNFLYCREKKRYTLVDFGLAMQVPGSKNSLLEQPKGKQKSSTSSSPKTNKLQPRRSTRLSPQIENKDTDLATESNLEGKQNSLQAEKKSILKPSRVNSANILFTRNAKNINAQLKSPPSRLRKSTSTSQSRVSSKFRCPMKHKPEEICTVCLSRGHQNTPRAGTPGFRSPEVLLKCPDQTTAVDIWSAGIILLCALSGRYPFFRAYDDLTALAQIISIIGSSESVRIAGELGKDLIISDNTPTGNLKAACQRLRRGCSKTQTTKCIWRESSEDNDSGLDCNTNKRARRKSPLRTDKKLTSETENTDKSHHYCPMCQIDCADSKKKLTQQVCKGLDERCCEVSPVTHLDGSVCSCSCCKCCWTIPDSAYDLLERCLDLNPKTRITAIDALQHPFFLEFSNV